MGLKQDMRRPASDKALGDELNRLATAVFIMGELTYSQSVSAVNCLFDQDVKRAQQVVDRDSEIGVLERGIDLQALQTLSLQQAEARDLRDIVSCQQIARELERISDYATCIAKRSITLHRLCAGDIDSSFRSTGYLASQALDRVLRSFVSRDADLARFIWEQGSQLGEEATSLFGKTVLAISEAPSSISVRCHLLSVVKDIERIGDHVANIADTVHYMISGAFLKGAHSESGGTNRAPVTDSPSRKLH